MIYVFQASTQVKHYFQLPLYSHTPKKNPSSENGKSMAQFNM